MKPSFPKTTKLTPPPLWPRKSRAILFCLGLWVGVTCTVILLSPHFAAWGYPLLSFYSHVLVLPIFFLLLIGGFHVYLRRLEIAYVRSLSISELPKILNPTDAPTQAHLPLSPHTSQTDLLHQHD